MKDTMHFEKINDTILKLSAIEGKEHAEVYILQLFPGVMLGINYVNTHRIVGDTAGAANTDTLRINYCFEGRCEVKLMDGRYVYVDNNALCIEDHSPQYNYHYPLGFYKGIQIFIDKNMIKTQRLETFDLFGIHPQILVDKFGNKDFTFIQIASEQFAKKSAELLSIWENTDISLESKVQQIRFALCQLFFYLINNQAINTEKPYNTSILSYSQYQIAIDCEQQITKDLSRKLTIESMATGYKVSPSSLKKFFTGVYGCSISEYTQTMRVKRAAELLETTDDSVMQIAASVGYENQSKFSAVFKKHTGFTPLEYKRIHNLKEMRK